MNILALYYNDNQVFQVTNNLKDLYGLIPCISILVIDNAFEINRWLMKHDKEIHNPEFLKSELDLFRKEEKFENEVLKGIGEEDVMALRQYLEDEILS